VLTTIFLHMNRKVRLACNFKCIVEIEALFEITRAVTYTAEVVISRKPGSVKTSFTAGHQIATILMIVPYCKPF